MTWNTGSWGRGGAADKGVNWAAIHGADHGATNVGQDARTGSERFPDPPPPRQPSAAELVEACAFRISELNRTAKLVEVPAATMAARLATWGWSNPKTIAAARRSLGIRTEQRDDYWVWVWTS